jgi:hypothetical protein
MGWSPERPSDERIGTFCLTHQTPGKEGELRIKPYKNS